MIWEHVIGNKASARRVTVDDFAMRTLLGPGMVSPLPSTCCASRKVSLWYYCGAVPIHAMTQDDPNALVPYK
ncbi:hypothetical protein PG990_009411 [Apiospora arundinis]|uniref:Uncharacterized protein n=1 Tax=Apiospora arundinis TaxID=335852 RepID=A0ABR2IT33_9PEZI